MVCLTGIPILLCPAREGLYEGAYLGLPLGLRVVPEIDHVGNELHHGNIRIVTQEVFEMDLPNRRRTTGAAGVKYHTIDPVIADHLQEPFYDGVAAVGLRLGMALGIAQIGPPGQILDGVFNVARHLDGIINRDRRSR